MIFIIFKKFLRQGIGSHLQFLMLPLFTAVALLLHQTTVQSYKKKKQGICLYTTLIANPSTGKSPASELIKDSIYKLESALNVPFAKSCLTQPATVEGLMHHLKNVPCMLAFYDEANIIFSSFGRYSGGNGLFDRAIYNHIFTAPQFIERDIKSVRTKIENPRYNMCLLGHPHLMINMLHLEKTGYDDGLFQRIICLAPMPPFIDAQILRNTPQTIQSIHCIFFFVHIVHYEKRRNYTFSEQTLPLFDAYFNKLSIWTQRANSCDAFLGYIVVLPFMLFL